MKPKLETIFPQIADEEIKDLIIEKIIMSKNRRKVKLTFEAGTSRYLMDKACGEIKRICKLADAVAEAEKSADREENNIMMFEVSELMDTAR